MLLDHTTEQAQIQATDAMMVEQKFVVGPVTSWLSFFLEWSSNNTEYRCVVVCASKCSEKMLHAFRKIRRRRDSRGGDEEERARSNDLTSLERCLIQHAPRPSFSFLLESNTAYHGTQTACVHASVRSSIIFSLPARPEASSNAVLAEAFYARIRAYNTPTLTFV